MERETNGKRIVKKKCARIRKDYVSMSSKSSKTSEKKPYKY